MERTITAYVEGKGWSKVSVAIEAVYDGKQNIKDIFTSPIIKIKKDLTINQDIILNHNTVLILEEGRTVKIESHIVGTDKNLTILGSSKKSEIYINSDILCNFDVKNCTIQYCSGELSGDCSVSECDLKLSKPLFVNKKLKISETCINTFSKEDIGISGNEDCMIEIHDCEFQGKGVLLDNKSKRTIIDNLFFTRGSNAVIVMNGGSVSSLQCDPPHTKGFKLISTGALQANDLKILSLECKGENCMLSNIFTITKSIIEGTNITISSLSSQENIELDIKDSNVSTLSADDKIIIKSENCIISNVSASVLEIIDVSDSILSNVSSKVNSVQNIRDTKITNFSSRDLNLKNCINISILNLEILNFILEEGIESIFDGKFKTISLVKSCSNTIRGRTCSLNLDPNSKSNIITDITLITLSSSMNIQGSYNILDKITMANSCACDIIITGNNNSFTNFNSGANSKTFLSQFMLKGSNNILNNIIIGGFAMNPQLGKKQEFIVNGNRNIISKIYIGTMEIPFGNPDIIMNGSIILGGQCNMYSDSFFFIKPSPQPDMGKETEPLEFKIQIGDELEFSNNTYTNCTFNIDKHVRNSRIFVKNKGSFLINCKIGPCYPLLKRGSVAFESEDCSLVMKDCLISNLEEFNDSRVKLLNCIEY